MTTKYLPACQGGYAPGPIPFLKQLIKGISAKVNLYHGHRPATFPSEESDTLSIKAA
jgi:hypothetical protein